MTSHKCYDCGKMIEPDRALRFFTHAETASPEEGYLCEACADRRLHAGQMLTEQRPWAGGDPAGSHPE